MINQVRFVDISRYYRTGGVAWDKMIENNIQAVVIGATVGLSPNTILAEQVDGAIDNGFPFVTFHIPNPLIGLDYQIDNYLAQPGVMNAWTCLDIEKPNANTRCVYPSEAYRCLQRLENKTGRKPLIYSSPSIIETFGNPAWLMDYWWWIAQWPYWFLRYLFREYEPFMDRWAGYYPAYVRGTPLATRTIGWQFTCKGIAQKYCANYRTEDPVYPYGVLDADLDISTTVDGESFLCLINGNPPPPEVGDWYLIPAAVLTRYVRDFPNQYTGNILVTLHNGDEVLVTEIVSGVPGEWGHISAYKQSGVKVPLTGYIYMNQLVKE